MRPAHYNTRYKHDLTPRQREVLELIVRGRTNAEIAQRLGLSLDGAKWHVGEILSKLNLDSREQAADYWRDYKRPMARLARTFAAISMPGALKVGLAGGAALGVAGIAVAAVIALRGGDEAGRVSVTPNEPPAAASEKPCDIADISAKTAFVDSVGNTRVIVQATAPAPCHFRGDILLTISDSSSVPALVGGNPASVTVDASLVAGPAVIVAATWGNWCGKRDGFVLGVTFSGGGVSLNALDVPIPTCEDPSRPSLFNAVYSPVSPFAPPTPTVVPTDSPGRDAARAFADSLAARVVAGNVEALLANATGRQYTCPSPKSPPTYQACMPYPAGQQVEVFGIAHHGSEGDLHERADFEAQVRGQLGAKRTLASVGCLVSEPSCVRFVVAFRGPSQPFVAYLVFETPVGESSPRLIGMGISGDNADTILNGGVTGTDLGQTLFIPVR